jgi:peptidoglycan/xylan/chitin deacetylase (PgdA/CDA1 family)
LSVLDEKTNNFGLEFQKMCQLQLTHFIYTFFMWYWIKTNSIIKWIFPNYIWDIPNRNAVYLTFDDGPTPQVTEWVLELLKKYNAKATFFCIGENIKKHPEIFRKISSEGHQVGNHTYNHLNGWQTSDEKYLENVALCQSEIYNQESKFFDLFRPPYGKITPSQSRKLRKLGYKIIMWDVLSADFDIMISKEKCLKNVLNNIQSGSIIVFHDSEKAFQNLEYALPRVLETLKNKETNYGLL